MPPGESHTAAACMAEPRLPPDIKNLRNQELYELSNDSKLVSGLYEHLEGAQKFESAQSSHDANIAKIADLKTRIKEIERLRSDVQKLRTQEEEDAKQWEVKEQEMYTKIQPYSRVSVANSVRLDIENLAASTKSIETKIMDPELKSEDALVLAKRYVEAKQQLYYKEQLLKSI